MRHVQTPIAEAPTLPVQQRGGAEFLLEPPKLAR